MYSHIENQVGEKIMPEYCKDIMEYTVTNEYRILFILVLFVFPPSAPMDTNLLSNIHKLFSERIDIFSPVEFNKVEN